MPPVKSHYWRLIIDQLFQTATKNGIFIPFQCSLCGGRTDDLKGQNSNTWSYCPSVRPASPSASLPPSLRAACARSSRSFVRSFVRLPPAAESKGGFHIWRPQWVGGRGSPKSRWKEQNQEPISEEKNCLENYLENCLENCRYTWTCGVPPIFKIHLKHI